MNLRTATHVPAPIGRLAAALSGCALAMVMLLPDAAQAQSVWEFTPYRFKVVIAATADPRHTPRQRQALESGLVARTDSLIGAAWQLACVDAPPELHGTILADPGQIEFEALADLSRGCDKLVLLALAPSPVGIDARLCEWDVETQQPGKVVQGSIPHSAVAEGVFRLLLEAFLPLAKIEVIDAKTASLQFRAAELPPRSESIQWVQPGDIYRPILRTNDRDGHAKSIRLLEWTYLVVTRVEKTQAICQVYSGLRSPLGRRRRGRLEQYALALPPASGSTRLLVRSRTDTARPLSGYDIYAYGPESKATIHLGRTGRDGGIEVPAGPQPLRLLLVQHGDALLARLPIVPGDASQLIAQVPDDDRRLEAEGLIVGLQENLVDLVVRRAILAAQARNRIEEGKLDEAGKFIDELRRLRTQQQFLLELQQQRQRLVSDDPVIQKKIDKLFDDTTKLLGSYLLPREIESLETEWVQAREQAAAPKAPPAALPETEPAPATAPQPPSEKTPAPTAAAGAPGG